jgi:hypothetical protein
MALTFARIQFKLPRDRRLNADTSTLPVVRPEVPTPFELVAQGKEVITNSDTLVLRSAALPTYEAADELGQRAQFAVLIAATSVRLGVDLGKDAPKSGWFPAGLQMLREQSGLPPETAMLNDQLGLILVDATRKTAFASFGAQGIIGTPVERFLEAFAEGYLLAPSLTAKAILALELFSASKFETSLRARFLTMVSAIECIAERSSRSREAVGFIKAIGAQLATASLNEADRMQLRGALRDLEKTSISGSTKEIVGRHCGTEGAKFFGKCYQARSELLHAGTTSFDLGANVQHLEELVAATIVGSLRPVT